MELLMVELFPEYPIDGYRKCRIVGKGVDSNYKLDTVGLVPGHMQGTYDRGREYIVTRKFVLYEEVQ